MSRSFRSLLALVCTTMASLTETACSSIVAPSFPVWLDEETSTLYRVEWVDGSLWSHCVVARDFQSIGCPSERSQLIGHFATVGSSAWRRRDGAAPVQVLLECPPGDPGLWPSEPMLRSVGSSFEGGLAAR